MLKKATTFLLALILLMPGLSYAEEVEHKTMNLKEVLEEEQIESKLGDYKESDDKATVYLFRGKGCGFCRGFIEYLNNNIDELGKYFNLVSYEVWYDSDNADLMTEVGNFTGVAAQGVPYIVVGEKVFDGFTEEHYGEEFKTALKALYESKDRYDVFEAMKQAEKDKVKAENKSLNKVIIWDAVFSCVTIASVGLMLYLNNKKLNDRLSTIEKKANRKEAKEERKANKKK